MTYISLVLTFLVKKKINGRCVREVSREIGPWFFLDPSILMKLVFWTQ
jgi:hypothetical protein